MAQNEMRAKPALPERVRSMEGLGVAVSAGNACMPNFSGSPHGRATETLRVVTVILNRRGCGPID